MNKRKIHLDILRIIACLFVIYNHTNERGYYRFTEIENHFFIFNTFISIMCRCAVPLFFMISGSLLISKEESVKNTYKRTIRIAVDLLLFSCLYVYFNRFHEFSLKETYTKIIQGNYWHLWYLYAYIALIFTLPLLRKIAKCFDVEDFLFIFTVAVLLGFNHFFFVVNSLLIPEWCTINIFLYPLLGYAIDHVEGFAFLLKKKTLLYMWLVNLLLYGLSIIFVYRDQLSSPGNLEGRYMDYFNVINAVVLFVSLKKLRGKINEKYYRPISKIAGCTFGVYLFHNLLLWNMGRHVYNVMLKLESGSFLRNQFGIFVTVGLVFTVSAIISYILKKIPIVNRLI